MIVTVIAISVSLWLPPAFGFDDVTLIQMLPDGKYVGTTGVQDFNVPLDRVALPDFQYKTVETAATNADVLITEDKRWLISGKVGVLLEGSADIGITKILLWNTGHNVKITMEKGAEAFLRRKSVRAVNKNEFVLSDNDDSQFNSRIKDGSLLVLSMGVKP